MNAVCYRPQQQTYLTLGLTKKYFNSSNSMTLSQATFCDCDRISKRATLNNVAGLWSVLISHVQKMTHTVYKSMNIFERAVLTMLSSAQVT